jgi:hypothetical protein
MIQYSQKREFYVASAVSGSDLRQVLDRSARARGKGHEVCSLLLLLTGAPITFQSDVYAAGISTASRLLVMLPFSGIGPSQLRCIIKLGAARESLA